MYTDLLMEMMEPYIRHCPGITGDGTAVPGRMVPGMTGISGLRCVNRDVSGTLPGQGLPVRILKMQGMW